jgi:hypothetical protein
VPVAQCYLQGQWHIYTQDSISYEGQQELAILQHKLQQIQLTQQQDQAS